MTTIIYILAAFHGVNALAFWWYAMFYTPTIPQKFIGLLLTSFCLATAVILVHVAPTL